jgi:hypothetical protein
VTDISKRVLPEEIVCCPLCDGTIETRHVAVVVTAHGLKQLVHIDCLEFDENRNCPSDNWEDHIDSEGGEVSTEPTARISPRYEDVESLQNELTGLCDRINKLEAANEFERQRANKTAELYRIQTLAWDEATDHCTELRKERDNERERREKAEAEREALEETLWFYADPGTYFAIAFFPDPPCGEFMDDFEEPNPELEMWDGIPSPKPGKRARAALSAPAQQKKEPS